MWIVSNLKAISRATWLKLALIFLPWSIFFLLIPPFHIPDEYGHYTYIQSLASGNFPVLKHVLEVNCASEEVKYFEEVYKNGNISIIDHSVASQPVPKGLSDYTNCSTQGQHPPLYYSAAALVYKIVTHLGVHGLVRYNLVRLTSLLFYILFLVFAKKLLVLFFGQKVSWWGVLLLVYQPLLLTLGTHINPEISVVTFSTITLYYLSVFVTQKRFSLANVVLLTFLTAASFYSKVTGIVVAPVVGIALLVFSSETLRQRFFNAVLFSVGFVLLVSPYIWWNFQTYGKPVENGLMYLVVQTHFPPTVALTMKLSYLVFDYYHALLQIAGDIARLDAIPFVEVRVVYSTVLLLFMTLGMWVAFSKEKYSDKWRKQIIIFTTHLVLSTALFMVLGYEYMRLAWLGPLLQIRYLFITVWPVVFFFLIGLFHYLKVDKEKLLKTLFLASVFHFNWIVVWLIIPRFYL